MKYWIGVVTKEHVERGRAGGFVQVSHAKEKPLMRMHVGDALVFYSPKLEYEGTKPYQKFTAIAHITGEQAERDDTMPDFEAYRRSADFMTGLHDAEIKPLLDDLEFVTNKQRWGFKFRFGLFEISKHDFDVIVRAMQA